MTTTTIGQNLTTAQRAIVRLLKTVFLAGGLLFGLFGIFGLFENLDAKDIMVIQAPFTGTLTVHTDPGVKWQGFGTVTKYRRRSQYWFSAKPDQGGQTDQSIKVRFNDGGHATISGSIAWEMPTDYAHAIAVHKKYGSHEAIEQQLVRTVVEKSVYMTGPLMSSKESYAERRNDLLRYIEDQIQGGVYQTRTETSKDQDPITGQMRTVSIVRMLSDDHGGILRQDKSPFEDFGIRTFNPSINQIEYDKTVESQIAAQQRAIMEVQTAAAEAKKAEQRVITVAKEGEAKAAEAKWEQERVKAQQVTEAEQRLAVAELDRKTADQRRQEQILLGEGEASRKRLVMQANGALEEKLRAYIEVNKLYADAWKGYSGNLVPSVILGQGTNATAGSGVNQMLELLTTKTAMDLGLDLKAQGVQNTRQQK